MIVCSVCEFFIPTVHSLKEKRAILQRMVTRAKQRYNIAIAEVNHQDVWQRTQLELVTVASSEQAAQKEMDRVIQFLESNPEWECTRIERELL